MTANALGTASITAAVTLTPAGEYCAYRATCPAPARPFSGIENATVDSLVYTLTSGSVPNDPSGVIAKSPFTLQIQAKTPSGTVPDTGFAASPSQQNGDAANLAFSYDQWGNMVCVQNPQTNGLCPQYSVSTATNQLNTAGYSYDAAGDLTADGVHTYQWDAEGRLVSVDGSSRASYVYDAFGKRVEKQVGAN